MNHVLPLLVMHVTLSIEQKRADMTTTQAMRYERRRQRELERCQRIRETIQIAVFIFFALLAFCMAGTMDYQDEQAQLAHWESQGITIQRW